MSMTELTLIKLMIRQLYSNYYQESNNGL